MRFAFRMLLLLWSMSVVFIILTVIAGQMLQDRYALVYRPFQITRLAPDDVTIIFDPRTQVHYPLPYAVALTAPGGQYNARCTNDGEIQRCLEILITDRSGEERDLGISEFEFVTEHFWRDAQTLAYVNTQWMAQQIIVYETNVANDETRRVALFEDAQLNEAAAAPDSNTVALWHNFNTQQPLTLLDMNSGHTTTIDVHDIDRLRWSPDSQQLVIAVGEDGAAQPLLYHQLGSDVVTVLGEYCLDDFVWSVDSGSLFLEQCDNNQQQFAQLSLLDGDYQLLYTVPEEQLARRAIGGGIVTNSGSRLLAGIVPGRYTLWSADRTRVALYDSTQFTLHMIPVLSHGTAKTFDLPRNILFGPVWMPDNQSLIYSYHRPGRQVLEAINVQSGARQRMARMDFVYDMRLIEYAEIFGR